MLSAQKIELLEDLPLDGGDKWYTLLAVTGHKKGSWLHMKSDVWREGDEPIRVPEQRIELLKQKLETLGIFYHLKFRDTDAGLWQPDEGSDKRTRYNQICDVFIANSQEALDELVDAHEKWDEKRLGYALGYPKTAVDAFDSDEKMSFDEVPKDEFDENVVDHTWFMLSRKHYREELAVAKEWLDVLERMSSLLVFDLDRKYL